MSVLRTNGTNSTLIQNESNHVRFERCHFIGHVLSPNTSSDEYLTFREIAMDGYDLNLQQIEGSSANEIIVENSHLRDLSITNSKNITVQNNQIRRLYMTNDASIIIQLNTIFNNVGGGNNTRGLLLEGCVDASVLNNTVTDNTTGSRTRGIDILNSKNINILSNNIDARARYYWSMGIYIEGANTRNILVKENSIVSYYTTYYNLTSHGIYIDAGDSIYIIKNTIDGLYSDKPGHGISLNNIIAELEVDSNIVRNYQTTGIISNPPVNSHWKIRNNSITNVRTQGMNLGGTGGLYTNNTVNGVVAGNGINITASNATVSENRLLNIQAGAGIIVNGADNLIANNFIEAEGVGIAKGISLQENGTGSQIVFNSINITGTDVANGIGLEVLGGSNYTVKNNIFANNGGGYASYFTGKLNGDFNYNNYYSTKQKLARFNDTDFTNFSSFQAASGHEINGLAKNPFYSSDSVLQLNQVLLNDAAETGAGITTDIDATVRGASPDFGAIEYTPCSQDAGINEFVGLVNPLSVGSQNVNVELQNQGTGLLTSAVIHWEVNGVAQTPFNWTGSLAYKVNTEVTIGSYSFAGGESYKLKAWTETPNGGADCNLHNDTARAFDMATPMCGIYTIGGTDPDFTNFTDAAIALNNAGITCPVVFEIRDGIYDEQIKLYEISGSSAANTITFRSESRDSSLVELHYSTSNPSNDFTLAITGSDYISFEDMSVLRTNGTNSTLIQNESSHVRFERCHFIGHVLSPNTSSDEYLTFREIAMDGYDLNLQQIEGSSANEIIVENSHLRDLSITNSKNITVQNNQIRRLYMTNDASIIIQLNTIFNNVGGGNNTRGLLLEGCVDASVLNNTVTDNTTGSRTRGIDILNSKNINILSNNIDARARYYWSMGIYIEGANTRNILVKENSIVSYYTTYYNLTSHGIYIDAGDSIYIIKNTIDGLYSDKPGHGISLNNIIAELEVDSNIVRNYQTTGIISNPPVNSHWKIRNNSITNVRTQGMNLGGTGGLYTNNTVNGVVAGNGINITASNATVSENRLLNIQAGAGIIVNGADNLIANNFIEAEGVGIAKGISLQENGTGSQIVFNSINITGTDVANGIGLEVLGGSNYTVKNNIFANNGGGYASYFTGKLNGDFNYNNYYSTKQKLARFNDTDFTNFSSFQAASGHEINGLAKNPFYSSDSVLQLNQVLLNDAAETGAGITTDIDATVRGASPDFGAIEYTPCSQDAGINEFVGLVNPLSVGSQNVNVELQNQGTGLLTSAVIHWEVNGVAQTPFNWTGSLAYKVNTEVTIGSYSFAGGESYKLKAWTETPNGGADCNLHNDTARAFDMATPMCGIYTIGGTDPDFTNFTDAAIALNNAGITCPVVFEIRDGIYDEQIKLYEISGSSAANTITFRSESRDSSLVELHYSTSNPSNDFTLAITGSDYISFEDMSVLRTNGTNSTLIQNESSHVRFERCHFIGHVLSPNTSSDEYLTFREIAMDGYDLNLQQIEGSSANEIIVENSHLRDLSITNSKNITVQNNQIRRLYMTNDASIIIQLNTIFNNVGGGNNTRGLLLEGCVDASVLNNTVTDNTTGSRTRGIDILNSKNINILSNNIDARARYYWSMGIYIEGANTRNILVKENSIVSYYTTYYNLTSHGIYIDAGDSIYIIKNTIDGLYSDKPGHGISLNNIIAELEVDSNIVRNYQTTGIISNPPVNSHWKIRNNSITNVRTQGMNLGGTGGLYTNNTVNGVVAGNGINITASNATVSENRLLNIQAGAGIIVNGADNLVANNFIEAEGVGIAKGISLQENGIRLTDSLQLHQHHRYRCSQWSRTRSPRGH